MLGLLSLWFLGVLFAGYSRVFDSGLAHLARGSLLLGLFAATPILVFAIWFQSSRHFRDYVLSLNPVVLTAVQTWRSGGIIFIILMAIGLSSSALRLASRARRFRDRRNSSVRCIRPVQKSVAFRSLCRMAICGHRGSCRGGNNRRLVLAFKNRHTRPRSHHPHHGFAAHEPHTHLRRAASAHPAYHLHRTDAASPAGACFVRRKPCSDPWLD